MGNEASKHLSAVTKCCTGSEEEMKRDNQQTLDFEPRQNGTAESQPTLKAIEDYDEREIEAVGKVQAIYRGIKGRRRFRDIIERAMDLTLNSFAN